MLFPEVLTVTRKFTDEQFGVLMRAAFSYRLNGEVYSGDDAAVDVAFLTVANQIDRYQEYCDTLANNAKGGKVQQKSAKRQQKPPPIHSVSSPYPIHSNPSESEADKPLTPAPFSPPNEDDVRMYCVEQGYTKVDPERFISYYKTRGWMAGNIPMADWRAAVDLWNSRELEQQKTKQVDNHSEMPDRWKVPVI